MTARLRRKLQSIRHKASAPFRCDNYGHHNKHSDKCIICEYATYCIEAKDPTPLWKGFDRSAYESTLQSETVGQSERDKLVQCLASCVERLVNMKRTMPKTFRIVMIKLKEPSRSYASIAQEFRCDKQDVHYHIKKAVKTWEPLASAILIDKRFNK